MLPGAITDINGNFTLSRVKQGDVIVVTYVGYVPKQLKYNGQSTLDITLEQDSKQLGEVVVCRLRNSEESRPYWFCQHRGRQDYRRPSCSECGTGFEGVVPGLNFSVSTYGTGGTLDSELSYNIRGTGTIGSGSTASPLVLIDGVEGDFNKMNPNDIETISVLKDAAACAIYGARASFGVILITTKSGKSGKPKIELSSSLRYTSALQVPDQMDSYHFALYYNAAAANAGQAAIFSDETLERIQQYQAGTIDYGTIASPSNPKYWIGIVGSNANTDWYHEVYKDWSPSNEENVSVSGGNDRVDYRELRLFASERSVTLRKR